jgi:hypothetical protein
VTRLLRLLAVVVLVLASSQLLTAPTGAAQRAEPVVLETSAASVKFARSLVLTATLAAPQPGAQVDFYAKAAGGGVTKLGTETTGDGTKAKVTVPVTRTATYYATVVVGGVETAQSASVDVVVAPTLVLKAVRVIGPVNHFTVKVKPAVDGMPVVLQRLVGKRWKSVEKDLTVDGEFTWTVGVPGNVASKWRAFVRGSTKYGASTSKVVRVIDP